MFLVVVVVVVVVVVSRLNLLRVRAVQCKVQGQLHMSLATDAARVGKKSRQNSCVVLPSNFAAWAPPTVLLSTSIHSPPTALQYPFPAPKLCLYDYSFPFGNCSYINTVFGVYIKPDVFI